MVEVPGGYDQRVSEFELDYWTNFGGVERFDLHLEAYRHCFPIDGLRFESESILDIGSGAISVFERVAPSTAKITPYDLLADDYNAIAPNKKFAVQNVLPGGATYSLVTLFNMIDHVVSPDEVLRFAADHVSPGGRVWLAVHLHQPHGATGHPQNFNCSSVVNLLSVRFHIRRCGVIRESVPHPYLWHGELVPKTEPQSPLVLGWFKIETTLALLWMQAVRVAAKAVKIVRLRGLLPRVWRF